jgi:FlaA1/EpsC-like NDP-sugar epimerase
VGEAVGEVRMFVNPIIRKSILIVVDTLLISSAFFGAFLLRFDGQPGPYLIAFDVYIVLLVPIFILSNAVFGLYSKMWRYASVQELLGIVWSITLATFVSYVIFWSQSITISRSILLLTGILSIFFIGGSRFTYRIVRAQRLPNQKAKVAQKRTLIIGGGDAGAAIIKELLSNTLSPYIPIVVLDDALWKQKATIHGVKIVGKIEDVVAVVQEHTIEEILITLPSVSRSRLREIIEICQTTHLPIKTLPSLHDMLSGGFDVKQLREVDVVDLLGRDEIVFDVQAISSYVNDQVVLITGGGGSIGSEIVRQLIPFKPKQLLILDNYENHVYELQQDLLRQHPEASIKVIIANIRDEARIQSIFQQYQPNLVFHAAAHKHVPLMEDDYEEAIKNNILGTKIVVEAADRFKTKRFILISSDKAVNPTNIMGATKRIAELLIQSFDTVSETEFAAVRFGNVLGSYGSVIPLFKKQIEAGGPITLTHPDITRYFMSIPEASRLVLQAGALAKGGEIFVLDMGKPVKIKDLAEQLIRLSGLKPYDDINIEITGLRPGEKLYEELKLKDEALSKTIIKDIFIAQPTSIDYDQFNHYLEAFKHTMDKTTTIDYLTTYVPSLQKNGRFN